MARAFDDLVVIGASAGGVHALLEIAGKLPPQFPAPVCIVQHIGANPSVLPKLLRHKGPNPARHIEDGQPLERGMLHVAPPDRHALVDGNRLRLTHGPKENHVRPAIDPLFRSAAYAHGSRVIGVVLTGQLDDGTAGLAAVKDCGGIAIVQDPGTATEPEMPATALAHVAVDHCVPLPGIAPMLSRLVGHRAVPAPAPVPKDVAREVAINRGEATVEDLKDIATPSALTCPDCGGGLWEMTQARPLRYRCHTGHAFSALSLVQAQKDASELALWQSVRTLREREMLLRRVADISAAIGDATQASAAQAQAERMRRQAESLQEFTEGPPLGQPADADR